jgi:hypothetical protein
MTGAIEPNGGKLIIEALDESRLAGGVTGKNWQCALARFAQ